MPRTFRAAPRKAGPPLRSTPKPAPKLAPAAPTPILSDGEVDSLLDGMLDDPPATTPADDALAVPPRDALAVLSSGAPAIANDETTAGENGPPEGSPGPGPPGAFPAREDLCSPETLPGPKTPPPAPPAPREQSALVVAPRADRRAPPRSRGGRPVANLPAAELAPWLAPQRPGDPLGLGRESRPPAPPDPDEYDRQREDEEYARSLMTEKQRAAVDKEIEVNGFLSIAEVRQLILDHTAKGSVELGGLDPELMAVIDTRTNYKIFVAGDNVYTREELYDSYPFHELNVQPEAVFAQQELGIFPPKSHALTNELEYLARDVGDESVEFIMLEDLVGQAARTAYKSRRAPLRVAKTKIYIGKEPWEDFSNLQRFFRGAVRIARSQMACEGGGASPILALLGAMAPGGPAPAALTTKEDSLRLREEAAAAAEIARAAREEELRRRAEEMRLWEERVRAERERAEADRLRVEADIRRLEAMFAGVKGGAPGASGPAPQATPAPGLPVDPLWNPVEPPPGDTVEI